MAKIPYTNNTKKIQHIGSVMLFPGDSREVEETHLPDFKSHAPAAPPEEDTALAALLELLDRSVPEIEGALPSFSLEELETLEQAEQNGKTRKTLIEAIAEERLSRASQTQEAAEYMALLASMSEEELTDQLALCEGDEGKLALVNAEIDKRSQ